MNLEAPVVGLLVVFIGGIFVFLLVQYLKQISKNVEEGNRRQDDLYKTFITTLQKNSSDLNARLDNAAHVIQGVQKEIGTMSEIGRSMKDLQEYLASPKLRGNLGEQVLSQALQQLLPHDLYELQYAFKGGEKVDAIVRLNDYIIPIDSKFPVENYRAMNKAEREADKEEYKKLFTKDVKKHIDDIARKYILTEEKTVDYAIMYIPSEGIYYEIITNQKLFDYSNAQRVLLVSPTSFYAYLKAILMSFQGQTIQQKAREILNILTATRKDYEKVEESLSILEKHLTNAYNQMQNVGKFFVRLGQKLEGTKLLESKKEDTHEG
ncbi:MAG: DNA recombination protein RmuC [Patescibacteria group bacterium]|jgi:DNA recombination protein RmuC